MASTKEQTTLSIDRVAKHEGVQVLDQLGLSLSTFVEMSLRQVARERALPFTPSLDLGVKDRTGMDHEQLVRELERLQSKTSSEASKALGALTPEDERNILGERSY